MDLEDFKKLPIMGILRGARAEQMENLTRAVIDSGLKTIEVAVNIGDGPALIKKLAGAAKGGLTIGAGTVLTLECVKTVVDAGATFIVSPVYVPEVVQYCTARSIPVFPGAFTPAEIYKAWQEGASMVKVFPANRFGPAYFKDIKGPFQDIPLLACGGVNTGTIGEYFKNQASGAAFGGSIFKKEWLETGQFDKICSAIRELLEAYRKTVLS